MRPKIKNAVRLNLYLDRAVVDALDRASALRKLSRSALIEELVNSAPARSAADEAASEALRRAAPPARGRKPRAA
ncbi:MAG: ribbon-helix-helix domain-containing protein [Verrucomicrobia bacterium]|nr:ribbon-helix-helix domain-containing protein [Verrucomicrobiota bacterium]